MDKFGELFNSIRELSYLIGEPSNSIKDLSYWIWELSNCTHMASSVVELESSVIEFE